ncbi:uncharacterized protein LOC118183235 [Stegodyphus dumicola]|uniref:uncharacterized protein LOC118183235 n=1 Tax=Stegodyphus dumicola TaxID=202533 RepID=UPI0015A82676|nr:uncharacterized protein LOC118183235 [Stegodyphus dumicola]
MYVCIIFFMNFFIAKYLLKGFIFCKLYNPQNKVFIYKGDNAIKQKFFLGISLGVIIAIAILFFVNVSYCIVYTASLISCSYYECIWNLSDKEVLKFSEYNRLSLGYGAALAYYKNYLKLFIPHKLIERIKIFESHHHVQVPEKLYILVPKSCIVPSYISNNDYIERCRELPAYKKEVAGIEGRVYNITVYQIRADEHDIGFRCALEYAQPLKNLSAYKNEKIITEEEMQHQRELFCSYLVDFLNDENQSCKYCTILTFDDEKQKVHEVLLEQFSKE